MAEHEKERGAPNRWGMASAEFYYQLENQHVTIALTTGKALKGRLIGVDTYDIIIRQSSGLEVLIIKGAIAYVHKSPTGN